MPLPEGPPYWTWIREVRTLLGRPNGPPEPLPEDPSRALTPNERYPPSWSTEVAQAFARDFIGMIHHEYWRGCYEAGYTPEEAVRVRIPERDGG